jgi:hypothetical protein
MTPLARWTLLPMAWTAVAVTVVLADAPAAVRVPVVLSFMITCPGATWIRLLRLRDTAAEVALMFAVSLFFSMGVAALYVHVSPRAADAIIALAALTVAGALVQALLVRPWEGDEL